MTLGRVDDVADVSEHYISMAEIGYAVGVRRRLRPAGGPRTASPCPDRCRLQGLSGYMGCGGPASKVDAVPGASRAAYRPVVEAPVEGC